MLIQTLAGPLTPSNATNVAVNGFTTQATVLTAPSGDGILPFGEQIGAIASNALKLVPFGVGADGTTFLMNVYGWTKTLGAGGKNPLWVPVLLAAFSGCTLDSSLPGVATSDVPANNFFCRAITLVTGNSGISVEVVSPGGANHQIAHVIVDMKGAFYAGVYFSTGASATSCNALWGKM